MKKILWLFLKATIIGFVIYLLLHGGYEALWLSIGYPKAKILNITSLSYFLDIVLLAISFLIAIKVLYKNNKELIEQNINKLLILFFITFSFFSILIGLLNAKSIVLMFNISLFFALFLVLFISFLFSIYFKILFNVFFLKKGVKIFWWTISIFLSAYILNFLICIIIFNKVYQNTKLPENFYLYPTIDITRELRPGQKLEGNSAEKVIELLNNLKNREISKNSDNEDVILPTRDDLQILEEISNKAYFNLSEQYVPEDTFFSNSMILNFNSLRSLTRGIIQSDESRAMNNLLILSNQLINYKNGVWVEKLVGIKIAQMSGEKLKTLNGVNALEIKEYLKEIDEILANIKIMTKSLLTLEPNFYNFKEQALFLKFFVKYNTENELIDQSITYNLSVVEMPTYFKALIIINNNDTLLGRSMLQRIVGALLIIPADLLNKIINSGKNYIFYTKMIEIEKLNHDKSLNFLLNNNFDTLWRKNREDEKKIYDIGKELIPE